MIRPSSARARRPLRVGGGAVGLMVVVGFAAIWLALPSPAAGVGPQLPPLQKPKLPPPPPRPMPPPPVIPALPPPVPVTCPGSECLTRNDRALVFLNDVVTHASGFELLYKFLERSGSTGVKGELGLHYRQFQELYRSDSSSENFRGVLSALLADDSVKAIDVVISFHGSDGNLWFYGGKTNMGELARDIRARWTASCRRNGVLDADCVMRRQRKLRIVYSAACYGASHASAWIDAGFAAAAGAVGVHTDSAASFPTFLNSWRSGLSFADAVDRANRADLTHAYDTWAKLNPTWRDANSTRQTKAAPGETNQSISYFRATRQDRFCAEEGQQCVIPNDGGGRLRHVTYGAMGQYVERSDMGTFECSNQHFGRDPIPNVFKACWFR